jgi:5S rRNA maturation endonuclease (ribonuclease M5)
MGHYLTPEDLKELIDPKTGGFICTIRAMEIHRIDGRERLVIFVDEDPRGIILTRKLYQDLTKSLGRSPFADMFFQAYGEQ